MVRLIFICIVVTFMAFPIMAAYTGISAEHDALIANIEPAAGFDPGYVDNGTGLTFEEIYAMVDVYNDDSMAQDDIAFILNDIEPASGDTSEDTFSAGFDTHNHPAL